MRLFSLDNGLRCAILRRADTALATVDVLYNVGARDESRSLTGMAHLFEHLMFGPSCHVASFDGELEKAGGSSNAWTSNDFTNFYDILPAANIETALWLESDRMLGLDFSESTLAVQQAVVTEEFKQTHLNRPYGDLSHRLRALMYDSSHPYSWPVIGLKPEHIAAVTLEDVKSWFYSHYAPNNAILAIVAPQPEDELEKLVRSWFGDLPRRDIPPRILGNPGFPKESVAQTVEDTEVPQPRIVVAYPMSGYGTDEYLAADVLTDILSAGRSSRYWNNLVQGPYAGLFASADASIVGSEHEGMLMLSAMLDTATAPADIERATKLLEAEFRQMARPDNISPHELESALNNFEAGYAFEGVVAREMALRMAFAVYHGEEPDVILQRRRRVNPARLTAAAAAISARPSVTLVYRRPSFS